MPWVSVPHPATTVGTLAVWVAESTALPPVNTWPVHVSVVAQGRLAYYQAAAMMANQWTIYDGTMATTTIMGNPYIHNNPYANNYANGEPPRLAAPAIIRERAETQRRRTDRLVEDYQREDAARAAAREKAEQLLRRLLDPVQLAAFEAAGSFEVIGSSGRRYRVTRGRIANIDVLDAAGVCTHRLCVHPEDPAVPIGDVMAAQLLHLRHHEGDLLRIANRHPAPPARVIPAPQVLVA